jgi:hypothetical protein
MFKNIKIMKKLIGSILLYSIIFTSCNSSENTNSENVNKINSKEWYTGGTLHNAYIAEWQEASYENKLATCSDWMAKLCGPKSDNINKIQSLNELKEKSEEIIICVDKATVDIDNLDNLKINEIALICMMQMGYVQ